ncbi:Gestational trophoblastic tumor protein 1 [Intoshia linei]|uniref:Gestational trophoblastic tumor protein 1 n=1 Tax=Intoshia linei TaxID=1819745 RepID=A0A177B9S9_9BILA|nr:Gestational trophoblastic tumor protein 1 [Intoshia linei]
MAFRINFVKMFSYFNYKRFPKPNYRQIVSYLISHKNRKLMAMSSMMISINGIQSDNDLLKLDVDKINSSFDKNSWKDTFINSGWEYVNDKNGVCLLRKKYKNGLYAYKVHGVIDDISAQSFYNVQIDLEYRKIWDNNVIQLEKLIDQDGNDVIHWVSRFPIYFEKLLSNHRLIVEASLRISKYEPLSGFYIIKSQSLPNTDEIRNNSSIKNVQIYDYDSNIIIKPLHDKEPTKLGLTYEITYYEDSRTNIPSITYSQLTSAGLFQFIDKVHQAAIDYQK